LRTALLTRPRCRARRAPPDGRRRRPAVTIILLATAAAAGYRPSGKWRRWAVTAPTLVRPNRARPGVDGRRVRGWFWDGMSRRLATRCCVFAFSGGDLSQRIQSSGDCGLVAGAGADGGKDVAHRCGLFGERDAHDGVVAGQVGPPGHKGNAEAA